MSIFRVLTHFAAVKILQEYITVRILLYLKNDVMQCITFETLRSKNSDRATCIMQRLQKVLRFDNQVNGE